MRHHTQWLRRACKVCRGRPSHQPERRQGHKSETRSAATLIDSKMLRHGNLVDLRKYGGPISALQKHARMNQNTALTSCSDTSLSTPFKSARSAGACTPAQSLATACRMRRAPWRTSSSPGTSSTQEGQVESHLAEELLLPLSMFSWRTVFVKRSPKHRVGAAAQGASTRILRCETNKKDHLLARAMNGRDA
eukprot:6191735-Pleurochrysis_carterae.AAC.2